MGHDDERKRADDVRDLLPRLFIQALDLETLRRFQKHGGGVIRIDVLRGSAAFASGHTYADLPLKLKAGLGDLTNVPSRDIRIRARVTFETANRSCVVAAGSKQVAHSRNFIVCKITGKSIVKIGKWHVWSADPWELRIEKPELELSQAQTGV